MRFTRFHGLLHLFLIGAGLPAAAADAARWEADLARFDAQARTNPPPPGHVLLLGSSSFRRWTNVTEALPGRVVVNRGFGGSHFSDLLEHLDRLAPATFRPAVVLIYGGDNDLAADKFPAAVAAEARALVRRLRARYPAARIGLLAVKPSPERRALLDRQRDLNARLAALARARPRVDFLDTAKPLLDAQGRPDPAWFEADQLHLNAAGYDRWRAVIRPWLNRCLAPPPSAARPAACPPPARGACSCG